MSKLKECAMKMQEIADEYGFAHIVGVGKMGEDGEPQILTGAGGDFEILYKLIEDVTWHTHAHGLGLEGDE